MTLTMDQKENLLLQYDLLIWRVVHRFQRRYGATPFSQQDLYQEAVLAFFTYVEKLQPGKDIFIFPFQELLHALCQYTLVNQVVTVPHTRTSDYKQRISSIPSAVDYEVVDVYDGLRHATTEDMVEKIYFEQFLNALAPVDRQIAEMKMHGSKNREVARALGLPDFSITRRIARMNKKYHAA